MEGLNDRIKTFLGSDYGYGDDSGLGSDYGYGDGDGDDDGYSSGYGYSSGSGSGSGLGSDYGYGDGVSNFNGHPVFQVDGVATVFTHIHGRVAQGFILQSDLTLKPCYIVRDDRCFAHGDTLKEAYTALLDKSILQRPDEERIEAFIEAHNTTDAYSAKDLFDWHHRLTGSCRAGREAFCRDKGVDMNKSYTVAEFVQMTKDSYGCETIRNLAKKLQIDL